MSAADRNETVHVSRRPPLPERAPDEPPPRSRRRTVAILASAVLGSLLAGYASAALLGGSEQPAREATATAARTATSPVSARPKTKRTPAGTLPSSPQAPPAAGTTPPVSGAPEADPATAPAPTATPAAPAPSASPVAFDAPIPAGWLEREFAVQKAGYLQSTWSDPADPRSYVLINWVDGDRAGPAAAAVTLRAMVANRPDYREVRFSPTRGDGWIWVYTIRDEQGRRAARIDLLNRRCGVLFAVLGSTSPKRFAQLQRTFVAVSDGIRIKRRRC